MRPILAFQFMSMAALARATLAPFCLLPPYAECLSLVNYKPALSFCSDRIDNLQNQPCDPVDVTTTVTADTPVLITTGTTTLEVITTTEFTTVYTATTTVTETPAIEAQLKARSPIDILQGGPNRHDPLAKLLSKLVGKGEEYIRSACQCIAPAPEEKCIPVTRVMTVTETPTQLAEVTETTSVGTTEIVSDTFTTTTVLPPIPKCTSSNRAPAGGPNDCYFLASCGYMFTSGLQPADLPTTDVTAHSDLECRRICSDNTQCGGFVFTASTRICTLYLGTITYNPLERSPGTDIGVVKGSCRQECAAGSQLAIIQPGGRRGCTFDVSCNRRITSTPPGLQRWTLDYMYSSAKDCQDYCAGRKECQAWNYGQNGACFLYATVQPSAPEPNRVWPNEYDIYTSYGVLTGCEA